MNQSYQNRRTIPVEMNIMRVPINWACRLPHYNDVIMGAIASQITSLTIVYSTVYSDADQRKHQSSASLAFVRGIHRGPVNSPHKWPVTRKMFPFDDVIMIHHHGVSVIILLLSTLAIKNTLKQRRQYYWVWDDLHQILLGIYSDL